MCAILGVFRSKGGNSYPKQSQTGVLGLRCPRTSASRVSCILQILYDYLHRYHTFLFRYSYVLGALRCCLQEKRNTR